MPWVRHVHGKFFGIDAAGEEPSVPVRQLIAQLVDVGYTGAISSEYEGWHWNHWEDAFEIVAGEQALQRAAAVEAGLAHGGRRGRGARPARSAPRRSRSPRADRALGSGR